MIVVLVTATAGVAFATPRLSELFHGGDAPVSVGGVPRGLTSVDSQSCSSCHAEIAAEWRSSLHAQSFRDEVFQASYAVEPSAFCRNCHAPLMQAGEREPDANAIAEGVSCAVCHVREEHVLGAHMPDPSAPHASMRLAQMTSSEFCAGCHQFNFPTSNVHRGDLATTSEPMQNTYREWLASPAARSGRSCQSCHMPMRTAANGRRYRSHVFAGTDPETLNRSLDVRTRLSAEGGAWIFSATLSPRDVGHAFPTGDVFRRLELTAWVEGDESSLQTLIYTRSFQDHARSQGATAAIIVREEASDTRVQANREEGSERELRFANPRGAALRFRLDYLRMPREQARAQNVPDSANRTMLREGTLTAHGASARAE